MGFDQWFEAHVTPFRKDDRSIARVSGVGRGSYRIRNALKEVRAGLSGKLSYQIENPADLPCVGDWVTVQDYDHGASALIQQLFPRKTFLRCKTPGEVVDYQMIAATIDMPGMRGLAVVRTGDGINIRF